jgi:hypothetical protein
MVMQLVFADPKTVEQSLKVLIPKPVLFLRGWLVTWGNHHERSLAEP